MEIKIAQDLFANEAELAAQNKQLFRERGLMVVNLLGSPGAGKTGIIRQTARLLKIPMAVIEGDPASSIDTDLLNSLGISAYQINTEGVCHLEATMVSKALADFKVSPQTLVFIENVGNLICTAGYPLGEALRVVVLGASEGDDKPFKYPDIFQGADAVILNKIDLQTAVDFNKERFYKGIHTLHEKLPVFEVSCKTGSGVEAWVNWLAVRAAAYWAG
ncbi:MAG: hydrogenase nickel incorporation protein HypB [Bacillota bacterium]